MQNFIFLLIIISICSISFKANAKTEGHYIGLYGIRGESQYDEIDSDAKSTNAILSEGHHITDDSNFSFSASYKYAFNYKNFFVAPGIFYDNIEFEHQHYRYDQPWDNYWRIKDRYGAKFDLGYDITDNFAFFGNFGFGVSKTEADINNWSSINLSTLEITDESGHNEEYHTSILGGLGLKYSLNKYIDIDLNHDFQKIKIHFLNSDTYIGFSLNVTRLGLSINF